MIESALGCRDSRIACQLLEGLTKHFFSRECELPGVERLWTGQLPMLRLGEGGKELPCLWFSYGGS